MESNSQTRLARDLGFGAALSIGVGTMIGAGIFVLPGIVASKAGPVVIFAFALCGFVSVLIALCMAELATGMPYADILRLAMKREEKALKFYSDFAVQSHNQEHTKIFQILAQEESKHKLKLETFYDDQFYGED